MLPFGIGIASRLTGDCDAAARFSCASAGWPYFFFAMSTSASVGWRYCCLARSTSCSVGWRYWASALKLNANAQTAMIALEDTAVSLPEQQVREILALDRVLL